jgi:tripartite-type tricarboxylate transporter receptor subunit TctC
VRGFRPCAGVPPAKPIRFIVAAAPDGYTLAQIQVGNVAINPFLVKNTPFAGTVKILAVSQPRRLASAPEIPTAAGAGLPAFELNTWFGVVAPRGTPERIIATLVRQIHAMQDDPAVQKRLIDGGMEVLKENPAQFRARMLRDHDRFREILKTAGLKPE